MKAEWKRFIEIGSNRIVDDTLSTPFLHLNVDSWRHDGVPIVSKVHVKGDIIRGPFFYNQVQAGFGLKMDRYGICMGACRDEKVFQDADLVKDCLVKGSIQLLESLPNLLTLADAKWERVGEDYIKKIDGATVKVYSQSFLSYDKRQNFYSAYYELELDAIQNNSIYDGKIFCSFAHNFSTKVETKPESVKKTIRKNMVLVMNQADEDLRNDFLKIQDSICILKSLARS